METVWSAIAAGVSVAALLGTIVGYCMRLSERFGKLEQRNDTMEARAQEDRIRDRQDFTGLFAFRNQINQTMASVTTSLNTLISKVDDLAKKVDELQKEK